MNLHVPLTPHFDQFVREQLAGGHFQSEKDVVQTALQLLEDHVRSRKPLSDPPKNASSGAASASPPKASANEKLETLHNRCGTATSQPQQARRSPRGLLADLQYDITLEDIKEARREMWFDLYHGEA